MSDPNIRIKRSSVAGKRPEISQLEFGELAVNFNDGRLFTRKENVGIGSTITLLNVWTENIGGGAYYNDGNIGVGVTNPTSKIDVSGNVSISSTLGIGTVIDIIPYDNLSSGTLSFEGSAGQLFSITNNLTSGSIFSVNDVSGIPSIDVDADGSISLNPFSGNTGIGNTNPTEKLDVNGNIKANGVVVTGVVTATSFNSTSDINLKNNIQTLDNALEIINDIRGVRFEWKQDQKLSVGVIAQEVEEVFPELVSNTNPKTVNYNGLIGLLIEAVKEQQVQINTLRKEIENYKSK